VGSNPTGGMDVCVQDLRRRGVKEEEETEDEEVKGRY
jgi:hypothetical protein